MKKQRKENRDNNIEKNKKNGWLSVRSLINKNDTDYTGNTNTTNTK